MRKMFDFAIPTHSSSNPIEHLYTLELLYARLREKGLNAVPTSEVPVEEGIGVSSLSPEYQQAKLRLKTATALDRAEIVAIVSTVHASLPEGRKASKGQRKAEHTFLARDGSGGGGAPGRGNSGRPKGGDGGGGDQNLRMEDQVSTLARRKPRGPRGRPRAMRGRRRRWRPLEQGGRERPPLYHVGGHGRCGLARTTATAAAAVEAEAVATAAATATARRISLRSVGQRPGGSPALTSPRNTSRRTRENPYRNPRYESPSPPSPTSAEPLLASVASLPTNSTEEFTRWILSAVLHVAEGLEAKVVREMLCERAEEANTARQEAEDFLLRAEDPMLNSPDAFPTALACLELCHESPIAKRPVDVEPPPMTVAGVVKSNQWGYRSVDTLVENGFEQCKADPCVFRKMVDEWPLLPGLAMTDGGTVISHDRKTQRIVSFSSTEAKSTRTKHIDVRYRFIRGLFWSGDISIQYASTPEQHANLLAKGEGWHLDKGRLLHETEARKEPESRSAGRVFNVEFASIPGLDERGDRLWMESAKWAADALNQSATKANPARRSPHEMFTGEQGPFRVLPFFQPGFMREDRRTKLDDQATLCYYLNGGDNHPSSTVKVLKASTGRVVYTNNVSWVTSAPAGEGGSAGITAAPTPPPFTPPVVSINFGPAPTPSTAAPPPPATTPPPAPTPSQPPCATSPSPSATPAPGQPSSASSLSPSATPDPDQPPPPPDPATPPLTAHAMRQLRPGTKAEGMTDPRLPSRTRSGTRHSTGLISMLDRNTLVSMLEARSAVDKERRELGGAEAGEPGGAGAGEQAGALAAVDPGAAGAGFPLAFATLLANREDIDATLRDQRPPEQRPDLPHCQASDLRVPKSYKEAMASEHRHLWSDSMQRGQLVENAINAKWVFDWKADEFGWPTKVKSRLVARGDMQREYIDFGELYAPTVSVSCVRMLAALACELNLDLCHFDVEQAFVRSELEEDVDMSLPQGCGALSGMIVQLGKSLYGLRQLSRQWHAMLKKCLVALGFEPCMADACVLTISQQTFTDELAAEYGVVGGRSVPMSSGVKLSDFDADEVATEFPFRELVGSLMWLATQTRPDIANAVRAVARYCASPKLVHWNAAMDILGYARRTSHFGISFQSADFASKAADRRSVSGGIVTCGGGAVSWFSRTQKCVTLSTTEAEYVALGDVVKEILFLRQIWRFMLPQVGMPCIPIFEDNQGAIQLAQNPISNSNSKHIDRCKAPFSQGTG
ncbi:unnamed protein product [Ectocarpus sp. CCAP 1310/34]|nr:unnamed protein product [Ectocarpus sp. CCAP 1310/34]